MIVELILAALLAMATSIAIPVTVIFAQNAIRTLIEKTERKIAQKLLWKYP